MYVDEVNTTVRTPPTPPRSMQLGAAGQPRPSPVQVPAYLHKAARPGATPNTKVTMSSRWFCGGSAPTDVDNISAYRLVE